jgi:hypothetical protein
MSRKDKYLDEDYGDQLYTTLFDSVHLFDDSDAKAEIEILRELLLRNLGVMSGLFPDGSEESMGKLMNYARWAFHVRMRISTLLRQMKGKEVNEEVAELFTIDWSSSPFAEALAEYMEKNEGAESLVIH